MDFDYRLLAKYLTGMLSPEEMKQVEEWRELSIDNEEAFSKLMKLRVSWKFTQYNTPEHIEKALNGLNARINSRRQFQIFCSVMRYAAVILLFVSFSYAKNASPCKEKHSLTLQRMLSTHYMFRPIM